MKQVLNSGHFWPVQRSLRASMRCHRSASSGKNVSSRTVAGFGQLFPVFDLGEPVDFVDTLQHRLAFDLMNFLAAEEIVASFHQRRFQVRRKMLLQKRHVLIEQLFLQGFGGGGNHHAASAANRWNQVCESFSGAGARFDDGVLVLLKGVVHDFRHC